MTKTVQPKIYDSPDCCNGHIIHWMPGGVSTKSYNRELKAWQKRMAASDYESEERRPHIGPANPGWVHMYEDGSCVRVHYCPFCGEKLPEFPA